MSAPSHLYKQIHLPNEPNDSVAPEPFLHLFLKSVKRKRVVYKRLASSRSAVHIPVKSQRKWKKNIAPEIMNTGAD